MVHKRHQLLTFVTIGTISQWGAVSKTKKDRSRSKAKEATVTSFGDTTNQSKVSRGGRAGFDGGRGGRGRGTDRGRGARGRGASVAQTNGSHKENAVSTPTADSSAWDTPVSTEESTASDTPAPIGDNSWDSKPTAAAAAATESRGTPVAAEAPAKSSIIPDGVKKSWASMFAAPPPAPKKAPEPVVEKYVLCIVSSSLRLTSFTEPQHPQSPKNLSKSPQSLRSHPLLSNLKLLLLRPLPWTNQKLRLLPLSMI